MTLDILMALVWCRVRAAGAAHGRPQPGLFEEVVWRMLPELASKEMPGRTGVEARTGAGRFRPLAPLWGLLLAAIAAGLLGMASNPRALSLSAALGLSLVAGLVWPWFCLKGVSIAAVPERERVHAGEYLLLRVQLRNVWPWGIYGLELVQEGAWENDRAVPGEEGKAAWEMISLRAREVTVRTWAVYVGRRGYYAGEDLWVACAFPFGIWSARRRIALCRAVLVWPAVLPLEGAPTFAGGTAVVGGNVAAAPGDVGDVTGVRPYRSGEPLRRVHWVQSARHHRWIALEREAEVAPIVHLVIDHRLFAAGDAVCGEWEWLLRIAASVGVAAFRGGALVGLRIGRSHLRPAGDGYARHRLLDFLAVLPGKPDLSEPPPAPLVGLPGGVVLVVTPNADYLAAWRAVYRHVSGIVWQEASTLESPDGTGDLPRQRGAAWRVRSGAAAADLLAAWEGWCRA